MRQKDWTNKWPNERDNIVKKLKQERENYMNFMKEIENISRFHGKQYQLDDQHVMELDNETRQEQHDKKEKEIDERSDYLQRD